MTHQSKVTVLLADDHALVREGLRRVIDEQRDMTVVAEAKDGPEALALAHSLSPAVALIDVSMPGWHGVTLAQRLADECPGVKVIAVTRHIDGAFVGRMLQAGVAGYVLKQNVSAELTRAVRTVAAGERYVDSSLVGDDPPSLRPPQRMPATHEAFSETEESVLRFVARAYSHQEIAQHLGMEPADVVAIKDAAMRKAGLQTRLHVIQYAQSRGWT